MKQRLTYIVMIVGAAGLCQAAHFQTVHEMTYCDSKATVQSDQEGPNEESQSNWSANDNYINSAAWLDVADAWGTSQIYTQLEPFAGSYEEPYPAVYFFARTESSAYLMEENGITGTFAEGWANAYTVAPGYATGNFYRIMPDKGEQVGDTITITIDYNGSVGRSDNPADSTSSAFISGGFAGDDTLITLNCQDYDAPQACEILHAFGKLDIEQNDWASNEDRVSYQVHIGDVIGIHAGVGTFADRVSTGQDSLSTYAELQISIIIEHFDQPAPFTPDKADLDDSGRVDMADFAMLSSVWLWNKNVINYLTDTLTFEQADELAMFNQRMMGGPAAALWTAHTGGGILDGNCIQPPNNSEFTTLVYTGRALDLTTPAAAFTAGMMFKRWNTEYVGIDTAQVGFVSSNTGDYHTNSGPFMAVSLSAAGNNVLGMSIKYKYGGWGLVKPLSSGIVLQGGHWYKLTATFVRVSTISGNWWVSANLEDYGTDGAGKIADVVTDVHTVFTSQEMYDDTQAYGAMSAERNDFSSGGVEFVDNFSITFPQTYPFTPFIADLSRDGKVDSDDLSLFASAWLWGTELPM